MPILLLSLNGLWFFQVGFNPTEYPLKVMAPVVWNEEIFMKGGSHYGKWNCKVV